jgi:hypothetical protein
VPNYRSGDVVEVTKFESISEGKFQTLKGVVIAKVRAKSLSRQMTVHFMEEDEQISL